MQLCPDNGGTPILGYELWMTSGLDSSSFSIVRTYSVTSFLLTHTLDALTDPISSGDIYGFKWRCYNLMGYSQYSEILYAAAADPPAAPLAPTINYQWSSDSAIFVQWT